MTRTRTKRPASEDDRDYLAEFHALNPSAHYYCSLTGIPPRPVQYDKVLTWDAPPRGIVATGASFTGKSTAMFHLLRRLAKEEQVCLAIGFDTLNEFADRDATGTPDLLYELKGIGRLVIDDLDLAEMTPPVAGALLALVEDRIRARGLPVFVTMRARNKAEFIQRFTHHGTEHIGTALYNRLNQHCEFIDFDA
ncbi:MAG: hypothetical protein AB9869_25990 [Verrucomicrobiia bacterium]